LGNNRTYLGVLFLLASSVVMGQSQLGSKPDNFTDFRPRQEMPKEAFVGRELCATCHAQKSRLQLQTAMAHALSNPQDSQVLQSHRKMTFRVGPYLFEITTDGQHTIYSVSDGKDSISEPISYAFGRAHVAQTYILSHNGKLYEGRVSYYSTIDGLDWTIGDALNPPPNIEEAFGRDITGDEARNCFSCHGTSAVVGGKLHLESLTPGVTCEACHGPGRSHVEAMRSGTVDNVLILDPRTLSADTLSQEFCGACHRSANTVGMMPDLGGVVNVRFQPYRIATGKHDPNDSHFACIACHDPHIDLPQQGASSDAKCTTCHVPNATGFSLQPAPQSRNAPRGPKSCPVAKENCDSCHMPKVEIPGTHFKFTDHRIRIVRTGEPFPF
jgi:cytochrome c554/c'-like protein